MFENEDWDFDEQNYFQDFNADEIFEKHQNEEKKKVIDTSATSHHPYHKHQAKSSTEKQQFGLNYDSTIQMESSSNGLVGIGVISRKNAVLDVFENSDDLHEKADSSVNFDKVPLVQSEPSITGCNETSKRNLILNIFQQDNQATVGNSVSSKNKPIVKSVLKISDPESDGENKFKRKKSVAFAESTTGETALKKICISHNSCAIPKQIDTSKNNVLTPTDAVDNDLNKNIKNDNDNHLKRQTLNLLKLPVQKSTKISLLKKTVVRQFPGPAGLLIDENEEAKVINLDVVDECENKHKKYSDICSQNTKNLFTTGAWQLMIDDLPADFELHDIATVKENAFEYSKKFKKIPYLAGIIQYIDYKPDNPHVVLKDFSGKIDALIHHSICKLYPNSLGTNIVVLVKDVGIIVTSKKYICIIISQKNFVCTYSDDERLVETPHFRKLINDNDNGGYNLRESQLSLPNEEGISNSKLADKNENCSISQSIENLYPKKRTISRDNSSVNLTKNSMDVNAKNPDHANCNKNAKITDFIDDIQDIDFNDNESWFNVNISDINSFTAHQFPSSTPITSTVNEN